MTNKVHSRRMEVCDWMREHIGPKLEELIDTFDELHSTDASYGLFYLLEAEFRMTVAMAASKVSARREHGV